MIIKEWFFLIFAVFFEVLGTSNLKASSCFTRFIPSIYVLIFYSLAFYLLSISIQKLPVNIVYATWSGLGTLTVTIISVLYYKQHLDIWGTIGLTFIITGTILLNAFSHTAVH